MKLFSNEPINRGRQIELDLARGLAVLFMVLIHVQEYFANAAAKETNLAHVIDFLGGVPAAPVFMFLLGIGIIYTRKDSPRDFFRRGALLLLAGYGLNLLRGFLPNGLNFLVFKNGYYYEAAVGTLFYVDIFQFSGLAMMMFGLIKWKKPSNAVIAVSAVGLGVLNYLLSGLKVSSFGLSSFLSLFWGSSELSFFPFLTWAFYPLAGYLFGTLLIRCTNKDRFYLLSFVSAASALALGYYIFGYLLELEIGLSADYAYYHHQLLGNLLFTAFVIAWLSMFHLLGKVIPKPVGQTISRWSRNVSEIYFIHWLLIGWLASILQYQLPLAHFVVLTHLILIVSDFLAEYVYLRKQMKKADSKELSKSA